MWHRISRAQCSIEHQLYIWSLNYNIKKLRTSLVAHIVIIINFLIKILVWENHNPFLKLLGKIYTLLKNREVVLCIYKNYAKLKIYKTMTLDFVLLFSLHRMFAIQNSRNLFSYFTTMRISMTLQPTSYEFKFYADVSQIQMII